MDISIGQQNIDVLAQKCQMLEDQCDEYVKALRKLNRHLQREVEKQKRMKAQLKSSEVKFRTLFEYAPFGAAMTDRCGKIILANNTLSKMLGYKRSDLEKMNVADITYADDIDRDMAMCRRLLDKEIDHYRLEKRYLTSKGAILWGSMAAALVEGASTGSASIIRMVEDISDRKRAEHKAAKTRETLETLVARRTREIKVLKDRLQAENTILKQELAESQSYGTIIGESDSIKTVVSQIELVAATDASVLIQGESGTGKELIAREIHRHSPRHHRPMVKVNCATIPKDLYESEFFGHVKGAYTGAVKDRIGRFEAADGGTIFLDEVGEIPFDLQSKLLRILQEGEYERLGDDNTRHVDVRLIAATNKDLSREVKAKRFRDDLFYRLNVFPIQIAPLRDRTDDIPLLAVHFISALARDLNVPPPRLTEANVMDLKAYSWPGNIRELQNAIERAIILCRRGHLDFSSLNGIAAPDAAPTALAADDVSTGAKVLTEDEIRILERQNTINALTQCKWKIYGKDGAAGLLAIKPTTLIERMKRMGIRKPAKD